MPNRLPRLLLLVGLLLGIASPPVVAQEELTAQFDEIAEETADLRDLPIETEIREALLSRESLEQRLIDDFDTDYPPEDVDADTRLLEVFGLMPPGTDLKQLYLDLLTEQIAGFYDPRTDELYVISSGSELSDLEEWTYAHEVTHALQDQAFDLEAVQDHANDVDDASLAISALIEGDATALGNDYLTENPGLLLGITQALAGGDIDASLLDTAPPIIARTLLFPYEAGLTFVTALREDGGWEAVDAAYADPPTSTEQILHPEKYLDRDEPTTVTLSNLEAALDGYRILDENNLGEFQTRVLLEGGGDTDVAITAAAGWDGDRYALLASGQDEVLVWETVWDSEADAEEFTAALRATDEARFNAAYAESEGTLALTTDGQSARIETQGSRVRYVLAPNANLADAALAAFANP